MNTGNEPYCVNCKYQPMIMMIFIYGLKGYIDYYQIIIVSLVFVTTSLAAAAGAVGAFFTSYFMFKSHDLSMVLNGILGGLVGITAGADLMSPEEAILIGLIAGIIIPLSSSN